MKIEYGRVKFFSARRLWPKWAVVQVVGYGDSQRDYVVDRYWSRAKAQQEVERLNYLLMESRHDED